MLFKKFSLGALVAAGALVGVMPMAAHAQYSAVIQVAPPAPLHEVIPAPREGFVWAPGHYEWRGDQYVWIRGHWLTARNGYEYREPRWVQRGNGEWYMIGGGWERGAYANRYDRRDDWRHDRYARRYGPDGDLDRDGIANRDDRDRDGDGVPNHRDRYPDDPSRY